MFFITSFSQKTSTQTSFLSPQLGKTKVQGGAEKMGMDPNAVALMKEQMGAHRRVYDLLIERTGIHIPEVEEMFAKIS